jgi:hypothetical protein
MAAVSPWFGTAKLMNEIRAACARAETDRNRKEARLADLPARRPAARAKAGAPERAGD